MPNPYLSNNREASNPIYTYTAKTIDMQRMKMMWVMSVLSIEEELVWNVYSSWSSARTVAFCSAWKSQVCTLLSTSVYIDFYAYYLFNSTKSVGCEFSEQLGE
jgi:magnesium-transporting ATPase (P-type)